MYDLGRAPDAIVRDVRCVGVCVVRAGMVFRALLARFAIGCLRPAWRVGTEYIQGFPRCQEREGAVRVYVLVEGVMDALSEVCG